MIHIFRAEQFLPTDISTAWGFFASAKNLAKITPPEMDFKILTKLGDEDIFEGMIINYIVRPIWGIPLKWQTEICSVNKPLYFTDVQVKGPYSLWEHTHTFYEKENGVLMIDEVRYRLPVGIIGEIAHNLFIKNKIKSIFKFREETLNRIFS